MAKKTTAKKKTATKKKPVAKKPKTTAKEKKEETTEAPFEVMFSRKNFSLKKVKLMKDRRGLEIEYKMIRNEGGVPTTENASVSVKFPPHPDLVDEIDNLSKYAVKSCGLMKAFEVIEVEEIDLSMATEKIINDYTTNGISLSGEDRSFGVIIMGTYNCFENYKTSLNTPRIMLNNDTFGFEEEILHIVDTLEEETFLYLFKGKQSQLSLMDEFESNESDDDFESENEEEFKDPNQLEIEQD